VLYTARLGSKHVKGTPIAITRTARSVFAPSQQLLDDYKQGRCTWEEYEVRYRAEMRALYQRNPQVFHDLIDQAAEEDVTLLCYEGGDEHAVKCHRRLLKQYLFKVADHYDRLIDPHAPLEVQNAFALDPHGYD